MAEERCPPLTVARTAAAPVAIPSAQDADAATAGHDLREEEERVLIDKAQRGDMQAFREIYERHANAVLRFAILPLVRDRTLGEDLLADTFVRLRAARISLRPRVALPAPLLLAPRVKKAACAAYTPGWRYRVHLRSDARVLRGDTSKPQMLPRPADSTGAPRS